MLDWTAGLIRCGARHLIPHSSAKLLGVLLAQAAPDITLSRATLGGQIANITIGAFLVALGLAGAGLSILRWKSKDYVLVYFGAFCGLYGIRVLGTAQIVQLLAPAAASFWSYLSVLITYVIPLPALVLAERFIGPGWKSSIRRMIQIQLVYGAGAILFDSFRGPGAAMILNNPLVILSAAVAWANGLLYARRNPLVRTRQFRVVWIGGIVLGAFVLNQNLVTLGLVPWKVAYEPLGVLAFLLCVGYVVVDRFFSNERRLAAVTYELETAREIQASILPKQTPSLEGVTIAARYIPMTEVGGDFYDFLVLDEKQAGILVADVSGHGVPAALVASMVKVAVSAQSEHAGDPARVLHGVNQSLCGKMERVYVTAMYVFLDLERGVLLSANAGHPPLIIRPGADSGVRQFRDNGLPLGLFAHATYENTEAPLGHGDRVVMYTDGIVEATNTGAEFFGDARFYDFIDQSREPTAEMFADQLIQHLKAWSSKDSEVGFDDDVTLIVIDV
jgi:sigma-B regulation protein RsbU (phosphoserine phosphatase)